LIGKVLEKERILLRIKLKKRPKLIKMILITIHSEDQDIKLNSMDDLIESQKKKVQKTLKFQKN